MRNRKEGEVAIPRIQFKARNGNVQDMLRRRGVKDFEANMKKGGGEWNLSDSAMNFGSIKNFHIENDSERNIT